MTRGKCGGRSARRGRAGRWVEALEGRALLSLAAEGLEGPEAVEVPTPAPGPAVEEVRVVLAQKQIEPVFEVGKGPATADATVEVRLVWTSGGKKQDVTVKVEVKKGDTSAAVRDKIRDALNNDPKIKADWDFGSRSNGAVKIEETHGRPRGGGVAWEDNSIKGAVPGITLEATHDTPVVLPPGGGPDLVLIPIDLAEAVAVDRLGDEGSVASA